MRIKRLRDDSFVGALPGLAGGRGVPASAAGSSIRSWCCSASPSFIPSSTLQFDTSRNDLVGANKHYHQNFLRFKKEFPTQDDLVVVVESENAEKNRQFVERLGAKLEAEPNLFHDVFYKGDLKMLGRKALLFVAGQGFGGAASRS